MFTKPMGFCCEPHRKEEQTTYGNGAVCSAFVKYYSRKRR